MGMKSVRMSRKDHAMPTMFKGGTGDHLAAAKYSDESPPTHPEKSHSVHSTVPKKIWPETISTMTPSPMSYARSTGREGKIRGRQADKMFPTK